MTRTVAEVSPNINITILLEFERVRMLYEQSMMTWIKTATGLITFGFAVFKFFEIEKIGGESSRLFGAREFSFALILRGRYENQTYYRGSAHRRVARRRLR